MVIALIASVASVSALARDAESQPAVAIGPDAPLATDQSPGVAFDGTNYLVVWQDFDQSTGEVDLYGARVTVGGTVLDPGPGIPIATSAGGQANPEVAFDGTNYLVVWQVSLPDGYNDVYGARVTPGGAVLDPAGIPIATPAGDQTRPDVAFDGTNYLVTWTDWNGSTAPDVKGARISPAGAVLDPAGIPISTTGSSQTWATVAFDGTNYLVAWEDTRSDPNNVQDIWGARVSPNGTVLDPAGFAIGVAFQYQWTPDVAFDGTNYLVTWMDRRTGSWDIYGARVSTGGPSSTRPGFQSRRRPTFRTTRLLRSGRATTSSFGPTPAGAPTTTSTELA